MNDVKWIKITTDMFDNRKIKYLRRLFDGDSIVLIWVMLLTLAGRCNSCGMIFLTENIPYTPKMLADELDFEEPTIQLALTALEQLSMIHTDGDGFLVVTGWEEHQNIDGMEKIREQNRLRKQRQRQKLLQPELSKSRDSHGTVTDSHATEKEIEKELEEDKKIYIKVIQHLNEKAGTKYKSSSSKTKACIHARLSEGFALDDFFTVIDKKCAEWMGTEFEKYLRPETLFGTKFEGYLNSKAKKVNENGRYTECTTDNTKHGTYL